MLYKNRGKFDKLGKSIGKIFSGTPISANQWTLLTFFMALLSAYFIVQSDFIAASIFFALMAFFDMVDGSVSRFRRSSSPKGAFYDTVMDRYVEFIIIISLFFVRMPDFIVDIRAWLFLLLFGGMMTTYVRASAKRDLGIEVKGGLIERGERLIGIFVGILAANFSAAYLSYVIIILAVLSNISALQRIKSSLRGVS